MKVGIVGYGFVGKALKNGIDNSVSVLNIDPKLNTSIKDLVPFQPNIIFICVPTPLCEDLSLDASIVHSVVDEILEYNIDCLIVLKSTILPNHLQELSQRVKRFIYNPEFLREGSAVYDFFNPDRIVIGGLNTEKTNKLQEL